MTSATTTPISAGLSTSGRLIISAEDGSAQNGPQLTAQEKAARPYWPYWRIHDTLYDLEKEDSFLEKHPGGSDFLLRSKGLDCTALFETHHVRMHLALAHLKKCHVVVEKCEDATLYPTYDWKEYQTLRSRVLPKLKEAGWQPGPQTRTILCGLLAMLVCMMIPFAWAWVNVNETAVSSKTTTLYLKGLLSLMYANVFIVMGGCGHMLLHQDSKFFFLGDLMHMSSYQWKTNHILEHHPYPNTDWDMDKSALDPVIHFDPKVEAGLEAYKSYLLVPLYCSCFLLLKLQTPLGIWAEGKHYIFQTILYLLGHWGWFGLWWYASGSPWAGLLTEALTSFLFLTVTMAGHNDEDCHKAVDERNYLRYQVNVTRDFGTLNYWGSMMVGFFLGSQSIHHLFPTIDPQFHPIIAEEMRAMGYTRNYFSLTQFVVGHFDFVLSSKPGLQKEM